MKNIELVIVKYNNKTVGYLKQLENNRIAFQYADMWIKNGFSISPFSLPLTNDIFVAKMEPFNGVYGVFYDSLPDGWGELLIKKMLIKNGINPSSVSELTKLTLIDEYGLGGLNYHPTNQELIDKNIKATFDELYLSSKQLLEDNDDTNFDVIYNYASSSGGTRPKANVLIKEEPWIVKFPSRFDSKKIAKEEYYANTLAKECGINVATFDLIPSEINDGYFASKRFDRVNGKRIHTVSLASLLETPYDVPTLDYYNLFQVIKRICVDTQNNMMEAFKRMCFNVFCFNKDDHGKNFSFIYDEEKGGYILSPAYDLTILKQKSEHEMSVNGNGNPTKQDLLDIAKSFNLPMNECKKIVAVIEEKCKDIK